MLSVSNKDRKNGRVLSVSYKGEWVGCHICGLPELCAAR